MHVLAALALIALASALALGVAQARRAAIVAALAIMVFGVVAVAMYAEAEVRYQASVRDGGYPEDTEGVEVTASTIGRHFCVRTVFGSSRGYGIQPSDTR